METRDYILKDNEITNTTDYPVEPSWDARFQLSRLPGCETVIISHGAEVHPNKRGQGIGQLAHKKRLQIAQDDLTGNYMLCTVNAENIPQIKILKKNKWKLLDSFVHSCTLHKIHIYGRRLNSQGCS